MRILGIDPGSRATGYGVVEREGASLRRVGGGVIRSEGGVTLAARLARIHAELRRVIGEHRPDAAALEAVFSARNPRSALLLGQARGAALAACGGAGLTAAEYSPSQVKQAVVGYGAADKRQVQLMVQRLLALGAPCPSDESDALAVAICHAHSRPWAASRRPAAGVEGP
ncbi:MAG: crossover junction endodeoxyribonuclease RuvC [Myxococcota bacterium]